MKNGYRWMIEADGMFTLLEGERPVLTACAAAADDSSGEIIDTRRAVLKQQTETAAGWLLTYENEAGLRLREELTASEQGAEARCFLSRADGMPVSTRDMTPLSARAKGDETPYLWRDLEARMLQVPYDNDMWMRYEAVALRAGRRSSDVTVLFREDTREGLLLGALDFDVWKNAAACPGTDARILECRCGQGACGEDTHDAEPHGTLTGQEIASSRFCILYGPDWRSLLETYGDRLASEREIRRWSLGVPFGFNSYAGLAFTLNADNFRESGEFLREQLQPLGFENQGMTCVNLDGGWQRIPETDMLAIRDELHAAGQLAGIYDAPFACFYPDLETEIPLMPGHRFSEIVLRDRKGRPLPRVDRSVPYDVTHPVWQQWTRLKAARFRDWGYDYLKIDFLSHGGIEGQHADPSVRTGREALKVGYDLLEECYSEEAMGRPFFLSLSIAPLFPFGTGNARRISCDAFGLSEDVEYVLNAMTYSWWTAGRLYQFNDPDHIVLQRSFCMLRDSSEGEARARFTSAAIAGSVMLLSEDYGRPGARERTIRIAGNAEVNAAARSGIAFRPAASAGSGACPVYTARIDGCPCLALFSWREQRETVCADLRDAGLPDGVYRDLWTGRRVRAENGRLSWTFEGPDAALLRAE